MEQVKLYYLNPNTYGEEMFVAATSREAAFELFKESSKQFFYLNLTDINNLPAKYTIDEFEVGHVVNTEIA